VVPSSCAIRQRPLIIWDLSSGCVGLVMAVKTAGAAKCTKQMSQFGLRRRVELVRCGDIPPGMRTGGRTARGRYQ
jgi:hypothetical protein